VSLYRDLHQIKLCVSDDGCGIALGRTAEETGRALPLGILGMRERIRPWGGRLRVDSRGDGGTVVTAVIPLGEGDGRAT